MVKLLSESVFEVELCCRLVTEDAVSRVAAGTCIKYICILFALIKYV